MLNVSQEYIQASLSNDRTSYIVIKYGLYNKVAKQQVDNVTSTNKQPFSNMFKLYNETKETPYNYISCEPNRCKLDGKFYFISDKNTPNEQEHIAYWSKDISNDSGLFTANPKINVAFTTKIKYTPLTLYFQEVCSSFKAKYYDDLTLVKEVLIENNTSLTPTTEQVTFQEVFFNKLEIEFIKTKEPNRYIKFNEIDFGVLQTFTNEEIKDLNIINEFSIDSENLSSNTINITIDDKKGMYDILNPNNKLSLLQEKQEIGAYHYLKVGNVFKELPLGTFLIKKIEVGKNELKLEGFDDTYFMNKIYYGGYYYNNESILKILKDLFDYFNYTKYELDTSINNITLTGYIPNIEFKEALRKICEAGGCNIIKTPQGITKIFKPRPIKSQGIEFNRRILFREEVVKNLYNNTIDIVEYEFSNNENVEEVFNGNVELQRDTSGGEISKVLTLAFDKEPVLYNTLEKDSSKSTATYSILNVYATSCVVKVTKGGKIVLKAKTVNVSRQIKRVKKDNIISYDEYSIKKVDNTLITSSNSTNIANWKLNRSDIKYNFDTLVLPYVEVGDSCQYETKYNQLKSFIPTKIEINKSIVQSIEGE